MNITLSITRAWMLTTFLAAAGCAAHPPNTADSHLLGQQEQIKRLRTDERRCRQAAEITTRQKIPVGNAVEEVAIHLTEDLHIYIQCMERAGWKLPEVGGLSKTDQRRIVPTKPPEPIR